MYQPKIISLFIFSTTTIFVLSVDLNCQTPDDLPGLCVLDVGCPPLMKIKNNKARSRNDTIFFAQSYCGSFETHLKVCCDVKKTSGCPSILEPTVSLECHYGGQQISCSELMVFDTLVYPTCMERYEPYKQNALNPLRCINGNWNKPVPKCVLTCLDGWDCNAYLVIGSLRYRVNKQKLSTHCKSLNSAFNSNGKEAVVDNKENINSKTIQDVLHFLHTGKTYDWTSDQYSDVMSLSRSLESKYIEENCIKSFRSHLNENNYVRLLRMLNESKDQILMKEVHVYIAKNFNKIAIGMEWLELNATAISAALQSNKLIANSEEIVFEGLKRWSKHDWLNRNNHFVDLMQYIRLNELSREFLVKNVSLICDQTKPTTRCYDLVLPAINRKLQKDPPIFIVKFGVFSISIVIHKSSSSSEIFFNDIDLKTTVPELCNRKIYFFGGRTDTLKVADDVWSLDLEKNQSTKLSPLKNRRESSQAVCIDGMIYVSGGTDIKTVCNTLERYDPVAKTWNFMATMPTKREEHLAIVYEGKMYLIGGRENRKVLDSVDIYDPELDKWTSGPVMKVPRYKLVGTVLGKQLFVFGGIKSGGSNERSVERLDFETHVWTKIGETPIEFSNVISFVKDNTINIYGYYIQRGGYRMARSTKMYEFNLETNEWKNIDTLWEKLSFIISGEKMCNYDSRDRNTNFNELCY
ncbi:kelch-like protein 38 isoform X2 [Arctopsyche grandis]|uniref:kelch-like protein 38 isoform X2 n=1 Tax=Arctopsyche grandis TaxID=121162 RepID=UPI00406D7481